MSATDGAAPPARPTARRFALIDGMILIAAIAVGVAGWRVHFARQTMPYIWWGLGVLHASTWSATALSLALVAIRLRKPRLPRRRLASQPGSMACVAVAAAFALRCVEEAEECLFMFFKRGLRPDLGETSEHLADLVVVSAPYAVAATWVALAIGHRWRPERGWIEPAGIALGVYWVGFGTACWACTAMPDLLSLLR